MLFCLYTDCSGSGQTGCMFCLGSGDTSFIDFKNEKVNVDCGVCLGKGKIDCDMCSANG